MTPETIYQKNHKLSNMKSEIKILCKNQDSIHQVMLILQDMGFERIRDISTSNPAFDVTARCDTATEHHETVSKIFERCKGEITQVQISKIPSFF